VTCTHPIGCSCRGHLNFREDPPIFFSQPPSPFFILSVCHTRPSGQCITVALSTCHRRRCTTFTSSKSIHPPREAHSLRPLSSITLTFISAQSRVFAQSRKENGDYQRRVTFRTNEPNLKQRDPSINYRPSDIHQRIHRCQNTFTWSWVANTSSQRTAVEEGFVSTATSLFPSEQNRTQHD
jgi:hypothetical protein